MKILMVSRHLPISKSGAEQRTDIICRSLTSFNQVDLVVLADSAMDTEREIECCNLVDYIHLQEDEMLPFPKLRKFSPFAAKLLSLCSPRYGLHESATVSLRLSKIIDRGNYDLIVVRYLTTFAQCGLSGLGKVVVDIDDLPSQTFQSMVVDKEKNRLKKFLLKLKQRGIERYIRILVSQCHHVWLPNPEEVTAFPNASCLPNIPYPFVPKINESQKQNDSSQKRILFVGHMGYAPNQEAMSFYVGDVWLKVKARVPDAEFRIIGGHLPEALKEHWEKTPGVQILGYVEDLSAEYRNCAMVVAPIFSGGGTNIKVLEAMNFGLPCLVTPCAGKGFGEAIHENNALIVASTSKEFVYHSIDLLQNEVLRHEIGENAGKVVRQYFSFDNVRGKIRRTVENVCNR